MPIFSQNRENYVTTLAKLFEYATDNYAKRPLSRFVKVGRNIPTTASSTSVWSFHTVSTDSGSAQGTR